MKQKKIYLQWDLMRIDYFWKTLCVRVISESIDKWSTLLSLNCGVAGSLLPTHLSIDAVMVIEKYDGPYEMSA